MEHVLPDIHSTQIMAVRNISNDICVIMWIPKFGAGNLLIETTKYNPNTDAIFYGESIVQSFRFSYYINSSMM